LKARQSANRTTIAAVRELAPGLWHWQAAHPDWEDSEPWGPEVSSYALDDADRLLLFDPLAVPDELEARIPERETAIVLTAPWHERDSQSLCERFDLPVYTPSPDTAEELMEQFGITAEQAGEGSPDVRWLLKGEAGEAHPYRAGDPLLFGLEAFPGHKPNDVALWAPDRGAVIVGDTLMDFGTGLRINERWLRFRPGLTREHVAEGLRPLLDLPVEHVLPAHGAPTDRAALEQALAER
jgi:glyoxylase-like metal-dependent hydrolase (beta-lactamase superfamily II)